MDVTGIRAFKRGVDERVSMSMLVSLKDLRVDRAPADGSGVLPLSSSFTASSVFIFMSAL